MAATSGAIRAGRAFVEIFTDDSKLARGLTAAQNRLNAFGSNVASIGRKITALGAAAAAPVALATRTFMGFEAEMSRVKALTGATDAQMAALTEQAKRLGAETVFTADDAARAMSFFALAGYDVNKIMTAMPATLNLAAAGQMDVAQAADIAAKIMAGSGIAAEDLGYAIDVLVKAMTTANTDLPKLGDAMKYVGPIAKSAGLSFEETVAAIQMLSNAGIQADMAGTTLRGTLLALTDPSAEAAAELDRLGVKVLDDAGKVRKLADIIDDFNRGLAGVGGGERLGIIGRIFDARQAAGFVELLSQGSTQLRNMTAGLGTANGSGARVASVQLDNLRGDVVLLSSAIDTLKIEAIQGLSPSFRGLTQDAKDLVNATTNLIKANPEAIADFVKWSAITLALGGSLMIAGKMVGLLATGLGVLKLPLQAVGVGLSFVKISGTLAAAALGGLQAVIALGPVGWIALAAGIAAASEGLLDFNELTGQTTSAISSVWRETFSGMADDAQTAFNGIRAAIQNGDFAGAIAIAGLAMQVEWDRILKAMEMSYLEFKHGIKESIDANNPFLSQKQADKNIQAHQSMRQIAGDYWDSRIAAKQSLLQSASDHAENGPLKPFSSAIDMMKQGLSAAAQKIEKTGDELTAYKARRPLESVSDWRKRQGVTLAGLEQAKQAELDEYRKTAPDYYRPSLKSYESMLPFKNRDAQRNQDYRQELLDQNHPNAAANLKNLVAEFTPPDEGWKRMFDAGTAALGDAWKRVSSSPIGARASNLGGNLLGAIDDRVSAIAAGLGSPLSKLIDDVAAGVKNAKQEVTTGGTFNGLYATQQLGIGNLQQQVATNTKAAADSLKRIERQKGGLKAT